MVVTRLTLVTATAVCGLWSLGGSPSFLQLCSSFRAELSLCLYWEVWVVLGAVGAGVVVVVWYLSALLLLSWALGVVDVELSLLKWGILHNSNFNCNLYFLNSSIVMGFLRFRATYFLVQSILVLPHLFKFYVIMFLKSFPCKFIYPFIFNFLSFP